MTVTPNFDEPLLFPLAQQKNSVMGSFDGFAGMLGIKNTSGIQQDWYAYDLQVSIRICVGSAILPTATKTFIPASLLISVTLVTSPHAYP